jgi:hypothetical protein
MDIEKRWQLIQIHKHEKQAILELIVTRPKAAVTNGSFVYTAPDHDKSLPKSLQTARALLTPSS